MKQGCNAPPDLCHLETVLAAERALQDFVANMVKNYSMRIQSVFDPLPITASEQYVYDRLREQLEAAKAGHREIMKRLDALEI